MGRLFLLIPNHLLHRLPRFLEAYFEFLLVLPNLLLVFAVSLVRRKGSLGSVKSREKIKKVEYFQISEHIFVLPNAR